MVLVMTELHSHLDDAPDANGDEAHTTNAHHDLCQVSLVVSALRGRPRRDKASADSNGIARHWSQNREI